MPDPADLFCTDQNIYAHAPDDFVELVPGDQVIASGADGSTTGWAFASLSANFPVYGVQAGMVLQVIDPSNGDTTCYGIAAVVSATMLTLQIPGAIASIPGQPPAAASSLAWKVATLLPQIENAAYDLDQIYGIDSNFVSRAASGLYDDRELRRVTCLRVLWERYSMANRADKGDWKLKGDATKAAYDLQLAQVQVKWGTRGQSQVPTGAYGMRLIR